MVTALNLTVCTLRQHQRDSASAAPDPRRADWLEGSAPGVALSLSTLRSYLELEAFGLTNVERVPNHRASGITSDGKRRGPAPVPRLVDEGLDQVGGYHLPRVGIRRAADERSRLQWIIGLKRARRHLIRW
jgi:hypothetical protein